MSSGIDCMLRSVPPCLIVPMPTSNADMLAKAADILHPLLVQHDLFNLNTDPVKVLIIDG